MSNPPRWPSGNYARRPDCAESMVFLGLLDVAPGMSSQRGRVFRVHPGSKRLTALTTKTRD
jgi:hypothetical protein